MNLTAKLTALQEVLAEIRRLNAASGQVVFSPAATSLLQEVITDLALERMETVEELMDDGTTQLVPNDD